MTGIIYAAAKDIQDQLVTIKDNRGILGAMIAAPEAMTVTF